ncbi:hypothetical protein G3N56_07765 [Desulfovibrio sulfodismutans]|uniref:Uncharacterized protein n=1 Tax=Desulfolutivibrio sulfodismutans TaxID=63561 RepID=A0A7K3NKA6_9BACT|nr:hypothetical protein [Desulfolutivibrio sulfodismutans]NDY56638.1 hypothetical protein [Desulfolutivibrio sulfodismutans]QLA11261.1 hypothetical protein GD606_02690 [Desulfolutivibrio sulfodismutans DSM 3696]
MSNPLADLRTLTATTQRRRVGVVSRVLAGSIEVLAGGVVRAVRGTGVAVGDAVLIEGDRLISRVANEATTVVKTK